MLRYSNEAKGALSIFYAPYNEVNIYVEDPDDEVFYENILQKIIGDLVKIARVFGLGGKQNLFGKVQEIINGKVPGKDFFIADGDFDIILHRPIPQTDRLHVLSEYCIENFLFEEDAVCAIIQEENPLNTIE